MHLRYFVEEQTKGWFVVDSLTNQIRGLLCVNEEEARRECVRANLEHTNIELAETIQRRRNAELRIAQLKTLQARLAEQEQLMLPL